MSNGERRDLICDIVDRFYDRQPEIDLVKNLFRNAGEIEDANPQKIINFYGVSGSGKSWLLKWLWCQYESKIPCFLSAETDMFRFSTISEQDFLREIITCLQNELEYPLPPDLGMPTSNTVQGLEDYLDKFLKHIDDLSSIDILLLIDDYDSFPPLLSKVFENRVLTKITRYSCASVVVTSRTNVMFENQSTLRLHTLYYELETFTTEVIESRYNDYQEIIPYILRVTAGLPMCVEKIIEQLDQYKVATIPDFLEHEENFVKINYDELVKDRILLDVDPDMWDTLYVLSIPRRFNIGIMSYLLPKIIPYEYQGFTNIDYLELIEDLDYLAVWNPTKNGYSIQRAVRQIISYYIKLFDADRFLDVNAKLLAMYESQRVTLSLEVHDSVEYLYHKLVAIQLERGGETPLKNISLEISRHVELYFGEYLDSGASLVNLDALRKTLETDMDIKDYITEDTRQVMRQKLKLLGYSLPAS